MNITENGMRAYIERFHETIRVVGGRFFDAEQAQKLFHNSLLPARIICYVSTQFGVAFEYVKASVTTIETVKGSARIEDLIVQAPKALRNIGPLFNIEASSGKIIKGTLSDGFPFRLVNPQASVTFQEVRFSSDALRWVRDLEYAEIYGDRSVERWALSEAENRAKDEVLSALTIVRQAETKEVSLHEYVSSSQEKTVLLLGSYDAAGKQRLAAIAHSLKEQGYEPVLIQDIPDLEYYDLPQKVNAIGALSRFVVIDDSSPSGHLSEVEICRHNRWITILLRAGGFSASWMTAGASFSSNVILEKEYDPQNPKVAVSESAEWAEARIGELKIKLNKLYPWRIED